MARISYLQLIIYLLSQCLIHKGFCLANCESSSTSRFVQLDECTCLGYTQIYECLVSGGGFTVWNGSAFDCLHLQSEIRLRHSQYDNVDSGATGECSNDTIIATSVEVSGGCYVSQLNVSIIPERINETIMCVHRDFYDEDTIIGQTVLEITIDNYYPPPTGIHLEAVEQNQLLLTWNKVIAQCPSIRYIITAKNCGICPRDTTDTSIVCSISPHTHGKCMFAVQTEICGSVVGERSEYVIINLYVPNPPRFKISCGYENLTQNMVIEIAFNTTQTIAISDNIDGSPTSYTVVYSDLNSGSICDWSTISTSTLSSCESGQYCQWYKFGISSPCSANRDISLSTFATNIIGNGPISQPVIFSLKISESNYCSVIYGSSDSESINAYRQISTVATYVLSALLALAFTILTFVFIKFLKDKAHCQLKVAAPTAENSTDHIPLPQASNNSTEINIMLNKNSAYSTVALGADV